MHMYNKLILTDKVFCWLDLLARLVYMHLDRDSVNRNITLIEYYVMFNYLHYYPRPKKIQYTDMFIRLHTAQPVL